MIHCTCLTILEVSEEVFVPSDNLDLLLLLDITFYNRNTKNYRTLEKQKSALVLTELKPEH